MNIQSINASTICFFNERLMTMGVKDGGLENYYRERIRKDAILGELDLYLIDIIQKRYPGDTVIHEIACGAAQLAHTLWLLGYRTSASEIGEKRHRLAVDLGKYLGSGCHVLHGNSFLVETDADLYVTGNAVTSMIRLENSIEFIKEKLGNGSDLIFNADLCGDVKDDNRKTLSDSGIKYQELKKGFLLLQGDKNVL